MKKKINDKCACARKTSIGGQALLEGIMMVGPKRTAMAVRDPEGKIVLEEWENKQPKHAKLRKIPVLRGVLNFISTMKMGYKALMRSAEIAMPEEMEAEKQQKTQKKQKEGKQDKGDSVLMGVVMTIASVLGVVISVGLFIMLPTFIFDWCSKIMPFLKPDNAALSSLVKSVFEGFLKIAILVAYMALVSLMKDIRRTFQYHGAEHKTIFCYENGLELTVENVRKQGRFHPRCGTSFLILMLVVGIFISFFIDPLFIALTGSVPHVAIRALLKLLLLPIMMGVGYELIKLAGRYQNAFTRFISAPGLWMQRITVLEPDDSMIECAIEAFTKVIPEDESDKI